LEAAPARHAGVGLHGSGSFGGLGGLDRGPVGGGHCEVEGGGLRERDLHSRLEEAPNEQHERVFFGPRIAYMAVARAGLLGPTVVELGTGCPPAEYQDSGIPEFLGLCGFDYLLQPRCPFVHFEAFDKVLPAPAVRHLAM